MNHTPTLNETIDQVVCSPIESLQVDLGKFSSKLESFCSAAESTLDGNENRTAKHRFPFRKLTVSLFGIVAAVTTLLNVGVLMAGATHSQLVICNIGIAVLYVLVGMCVISDLSRGRTHFQSERQLLHDKLKRVAEQLRELVRERQHWSTEATRSKWAIDNENLKLQMAKQQVESTQEKYELGIANIQQKEKALAELQERWNSNEAANATLLAETLELDARRTQRSTDIDDLMKRQAQVENDLIETTHAHVEAVGKLEYLQVEVIATEASLASTTASLASTTASLKRLEEECLTNTIENDRIQQENLALLQSISENEIKRSQLEELLTLLTLEMDNLRIANEVRKVSLIDELTAAELAILLANQTRERVDAETSQHEVDCENWRNKLAETKRSHVEWVNLAVALEKQVSQQQESIILGEARLRTLQENTITKRSELEAIGSEWVEAEHRIALLLTQLADLENLSAVKLASDTIALSQNHEPAMDGEQLHRTQEEIAEQANRQEDLRQELAAIRSELDERQLLIEDSFQNSLKLTRDAEKSISDAKRRVEMLTEKADSLAEQVEVKSSELFSYKQDLMTIRAEIRELEASKLAAEGRIEELAAVELQMERRQDELSELETQVADSQELIVRKQEALGQIETQTVAIQAKLESLELEISDRSLAIQHLEVRHAEIVDDCSRLAEARRDNVGQVEIAASDLAEIQNCIQEQLDRHALLVAEHLTLVNESEQLAQSNRRLMEQNEAAELEGAKLTQLANECLELEMQIEYSNRRLEQLADEQDSLVQAIESQKTTLNIESLRMQELQLELPRLEKKLATDQVKQMDLERELCELTEMIESAHIEKIEVESEEKAAKARVAEWTQRASEIEHECSVSIAKLQRLSDEVEEAQGIVEQWTKYIATLKCDQKGTEESIQELEQRIGQLKDQVSIATSSLQASNDDLESSQSELQDVQAEYQRAELDLKTACNELEATILQREIESDRHSQIQSSWMDLEKQSLAVEAQLDAALQELANVNEELKSKFHHRMDIEQSVEELQERLRSQGMELGEIREERDSLAIANCSAASAIDGAKTELAELESRIANLEQVEEECKTRQVTLQGLLEQIEDRRTDLLSLNKDVDSMEAKKSELLKIEFAYEQGKVSLSKISSEVAFYESRLSLLEKEIAQRDATCADRQIELEQMDQRAEDRLSVLRSMEKDLQGSRDHSAQLQLQIQLDSDRLQTLVQKIATKTTQADELEYHLDVLQRESAKLNSRRKTIEESIAVLMQSESDWNGKILDVTKRHDENLSAAQHGLEEAQNELNETKLGIAEAQEAKSAMIRSNGKMEIEWLQRSSDIRSLESSIAKANEKLQELEIKHSRLVPEVTVLREQCSELEKQRRAMTEAIGALAFEKVQFEEEQLKSQAIIEKARLEKEELESRSQEIVSWPKIENSTDWSLQENTSAVFETEEVTLEGNILAEVNALTSISSSPQFSNASKWDAWDTVFAGTTAAPE